MVDIAKHLLLTVGGTYVASNQQSESWQFGVRLALVAGDVDPIGSLPTNWEVQPDAISRTETHWNIDGNWQIANLVPPGTFHADDYLNDQVAPAVSAFLGGTPCSSNLKTEYAKIYPIGTPDGRAIPAPPYASGTPVALTWTSSFPTGGSGSNYLPLQCSVGVSWRTPQIGRRGRGRIFLPPMTVAGVDAQGFLSSTQQTNTRDSAVAFLEALAFDGSGGNPWHVRPIVTGAPWTTYGVITQVRVDNVIDTQRRRRRQLEGSILSGTPSY